MTKEDFVQRYRNWGDEKLIASFHQRKDFQPLAVEAMLSVMKERKLNMVAETILANDELQEAVNIKREKQQIQIEQNEYEEKVLGTNEDAVSFAKRNKDNRGFYASANISYAAEAALRFFLIIPLSISTIAFVFGIVEKPLFEYAQEITGSLSAISIFLFVQSIIKSKASFRLFENSLRKTVFEIIHGKEIFTATIPFNYSVAYDITEIRAHGIKITHPVLFLYIENEKEEKIRLTENLNAIQNPPPAWPRVQFGNAKKKMKVFTQLTFEKPQLIRLKKILDGLHELQRK